MKDTSMKDKLDKLNKIVWKTITSPKAVVAFNVTGLLLQALHQIDAYRAGNRKVGFRKAE